MPKATLFTALYDRTLALLGFTGLPTRTAVLTFTARYPFVITSLAPSLRLPALRHAVPAFSPSAYSGRHTLLSLSLPHLTLSTSSGASSVTGTSSVAEHAPATTANIANTAHSLFILPRPPADALA
eukprot:CAMPEP_0198725346 /NCGR_PEP_ID=MMETSP1475-20131203/2666_1 /TAXON_ID= ORGANISM="Unidentified sp., Strain CCMP1999" /NCGR_SAMPLE_ID=MMETSP1475 /ASSEMBLY_ACC=CAM_ASM_001111 /LENGTH=125 /DNA_ID=CAMNT_0044487101 /DNA_START=357 /DNA_END=730 /DNA_ORIENTATION=-